MRILPSSFAPYGGVGSRGSCKNKITKKVINIISYTFLVIIIYIFTWDLRVFDIFQIFIFSIFSFAISMYISDKFKLSNNKFIKILQKLVFINSILALISLILYLFDVSIIASVFCSEISEDEMGPNGLGQENQFGENNNNKNKDVVQITSNINDKNEEYYSFKIKKDLIDKVVEKGKDLLVVGVTDTLGSPNLGIGAAVGKVASETFKHTSGMAPLARIAMVGSTAIATAAGTKIGIDLGKALIENKKIENEIDSNDMVLETINKDGRNSPSDFDGGFIHSVLESEIPLVTMVNGLCFLNYIEFILILSLFSLLFRKYFTRKLIGFILSLFRLQPSSAAGVASLPLTFFLLRTYKKKVRALRGVPSYSNGGLKRIIKNKEGKNNNLESLRSLRSLRSKPAPLLRSRSALMGEGYAGGPLWRVTLNKALNTLDKYTDFFIIFIFLCLLWLKFINIYFSSNLAKDIDSFVNVYNYIKNNRP